ncbi:hypothetical protein PGH26_02045 [Sporosarcina jeotgali]|uniref:Uncharacterized protein n=1 Tax=Sporosarcina jeotgali TaxID=3020056 RepID=A0ABZ0KWF7_9BACL|nr:hypothetical protein [Sporosarcina sp. B2O-1]WOV84730.1 hypothetical protein PGH26_02045 [Sporosarcina sp. B2O-1]
MACQLDSLIYEEQNDVNYDVDSSPLAWEHYKKVYDTKQWPLIAKFDLNNIRLRRFKHENITYTRLLVRIKIDSSSFNEERKWSKFTLGGDCDFNFNEKKVSKFKKILGESNELLNYCSRRHHTLLNFSIMPATGGMNSFKGIKPFDRLDTFVYHLNQYYTKKDELILSNSRYNKQPLIDFLNTFDNIYDYCKKIYFLSNKDFVDRLILEGERPLLVPKDVVRYMQLAKDYWNEKENSWNEMNLYDSNPDSNNH